MHRHFSDRERRELALVFLKDEKRTPLALKYSLAFQLYPRFLEIDFLRDFLRRRVNSLLEYYNFGQILSLDEASAVIEVAKHVGVIDCWCRRRHSGDSEPYCLAIGAFSDFAEGIGSFKSQLSIEEAKEFLRRMHSQNYFHSIWTLKTPFLSTICSCDLIYCWGYRGRFKYGIEQALLRGHYYSTTNAEKCIGCKACIENCPFQARILKEGIAYVDVDKCMGCGLCVDKCEQAAITLKENIN
jgi:Pyruvate/2-oxoacid:ferredoxin oxidoreductase delta subunit